LQIEKSESLLLAAALSNASSPLDSVASRISANVETPSRLTKHFRRDSLKQLDIEAINGILDLSLTTAFQNVEKGYKVKDDDDKSEMMSECECEGETITVLNSFQACEESWAGSEEMELDDEPTRLWCPDPVFEISSDFAEGSSSGEDTPAAMVSALYPDCGLLLIYAGLALRFAHGDS
jgi:hypothetical protein